MGVSTGEKSKETPDAETPLKSVANGQTERPPSYNAEQLALELPKLNLSAPPNYKSSGPVPRDQCVAHLKLLAVLADLRDFISNDDGLFGLFDSEAGKFPDSLNEAKAKIREKRWAVYTARAVDRYTKWWFTCLPMSRPQVTMKDLEDPKYEEIVDCDTSIAWRADNLPPIGEWRLGISGLSAG